MARRHAHTHACGICQGSIRCTGPIVENYDGIPEAYCETYPPDQQPICEDCQSQGLCDIGETGCKGVGDRQLPVPYLDKPLWVCEPCAVYEQQRAQDEQDIDPSNMAVPFARNN
jgi:hypothetical protein